MTRRPPPDPATYRPSRHSRPPSTARMAGSCEACSGDINVGDQITRRNGFEIHTACDGKE